MRHLIRRAARHVTCPDTGRRYPIPAGGAGDDDPKPDPKPDPKGDPPDPKADPTPDPKDDPKPPGDGTDWKAESRKWEQRAKDNKAAADRLKEIEDADKTEAQKAADRATEAEQRAEKAEARAARLDAAVKHGLSADDLELLDGVPADKVEERAKKLAERLGNASKGDGEMPPASNNQGRQPGDPSSKEAGREEARRRFGSRDKDN